MSEMCFMDVCIVAILYFVFLFMQCVIVVFYTALHVSFIDKVLLQELIDFVCFMTYSLPLPNSLKTYALLFPVQCLDIIIGFVYLEM